MAWAPDYATGDELLHYVSSGTVDPGDDFDAAEAALAVTAASRAVDYSCGPGRQFGRLDAPATMVYDLRWSPRRQRAFAYIDDLMSVAGLAVSLAGTAIATGYELHALNAAVWRRPWTTLVLPADTVWPDDPVGALSVTADSFGWTAVPDDIVQATLMQGSRFLARRTSPFGVAGSPSDGSEMRLQARVDPDVAVSVAPYRLDRKAVK